MTITVYLVDKDDLGDPEGANDVNPLVPRPCKGFECAARVWAQHARDRLGHACRTRRAEIVAYVKETRK